jgi:hypothetical protein
MQRKRVSEQTCPVFTGLDEPFFVVRLATLPAELIRETARTFKQHDELDF